MANELDSLFMADVPFKDDELDNAFVADPIEVAQDAPEDDLSTKLDKSWDRRQSEVEELRTRYELGYITKKQFDSRSVGKAAGYMGDVLGNTFMSGAETIYEEAIKPAADLAEWLVTYNGESKVVNATNDAVIAGWEKFSTSSVAEEAQEAVQKGYKWYKKWSIENPEAAEDFEAFVNIGLLFTPYKTRSNAVPTEVPGLVSKTGDDLIKWGVEQTANTRVTQAKQMLMPDKPTRQQLENTEQVGIFRTNVITPDAFEDEMIKNVSRIKGLNTKRSPTHYFQMINKDIDAKATQLIKDLDATGVVLPHTTVIKKVESVLDETLNKYFGGTDDAVLRKAIQGDIEDVKAILLKHGETPSGVLAARKEIDKVIRDKYKFKDDGSVLPTKAASLDIIRRALNEATIESVPDVAVRKSLNYQFSLYRAKDAIEDKAINDAKNGVGRVLGNVTKVIDLKMQSNRTLAILFGQSAFAVASGYMQGIGAGVLAYGAAQAVKMGVNSPKTKFAFGHLLKQIDKAIQASKNGKMKEALRADRIIVQDLFEMPVEKENKEK
jgi:hypothetical protein